MTSRPLSTAVRLINLVYTRLAGAYLGPEIVNNGEFSIFDVIEPEYCVNAVDGGNTRSGAPPPEELYCGGIEGDIDTDRPKGIGSFVFEVEEKTDCALDQLCVEWKFNSAVRQRLLRRQVQLAV